MQHPFYSRDKLVFAHRGGAALAPENTLAAFAHALALGSDGLECDVRLSRDGVPVVIHDKTLDRTTDAAGPVSALSADELRAVDAGFRFRDAGGRFSFRGQGVGVPTLEELLRTFPGARVIIEMKGGAPVLARAVLDVLRRTGALERVCVGSFYRAGVEVIRADEPTLATSACENEVRWTIYRAWCHWPFARRRRYCAFQVPERSGWLRVVSPSFVQQAHRNHARVDVWVVDRREDVQRLFGWGVDGVITDRPDVATAVRDDWMQKASASSA